MRKKKAHAEDACAPVENLRDSRQMSLALAPSVSAISDRLTFQRLTGEGSFYLRVSSGSFFARLAPSVPGRQPVLSPTPIKLSALILRGIGGKVKRMRDRE